MASSSPLDPALLRRVSDPARLGFKTTDGLEPLDRVLGQDRAIEALRFAIGMRRDGYNVFALGPAETGMEALIRSFLRRCAAKNPAPADWVYVYNFEEEHKPRALELPSGRAPAFRDDMERLVDDLQGAVPAAFEGEAYRTRRQALDEELGTRQERALDEVQAHARAQRIALVRTPIGFAFAPMREGEVIKPEEFHRLPEPEQEKIKSQIEKLQEELQTALRALPRWHQEHRDKLRGLDREVVGYAVGHLMGDLQARYADLPGVLDHLRRVAEDVVENADEFLSAPGGSGGGPGGEGPPRPMFGGEREEAGRRYLVNVMVQHDDGAGAPVVFEGHPSHPNLMGRVEYMARFGALVADFRLIKPGALHRANGGYLVLDARKILTQPFVWEDLKRALRSRELRIESPGQSLGLISTVSLEPEPIPLSVKIVLLGDRMLYYLLAEYDPEFRELFKVAADFNDDVERSDGMAREFARLIAEFIRREKLRPFDAGAVAAVLDHAARLTGDAEKLTAYIEPIVDLLRETEYWAAQEGRDVVAAQDVRRAIDAQIARASRLRERMHENIVRGTLLIDTAGAAVGQVNGLSVIQMGALAFGRPSRITATVRLGRGEVVDIEREVKLGGPIHSKGVLIIGGFLGSRYAPDGPLSLHASLVFEQSYGGVEGDSASLAETCALLSALAGIPIRQSLAITGSMNQWGQAQPIGGVNEKIEGFFDVCRSRGLDGGHGVIIPLSNMPHLMLREDVVEAVREGKFRVYAVSNIDEALELMTGVPAGARDASGHYPSGSANFAVSRRIAELGEKARSIAMGPSDFKRAGAPAAGVDANAANAGTAKASGTGAGKS